MSSVQPEYLTDEGYLVGVGATAMTGGGITVFKKSALETALWACGEDTALDAVNSGLARHQVEAIGVRHCKLIHEADPGSRAGAGYPFDKALALAAVEILEGSARRLTRNRRRTASTDRTE